MPQGAGIMYIEPRSPVRSGFKQELERRSSSRSTSSQPAQRSRTTNRLPGKSITKTLLWLAPVVTVWPYLLSKLHYSLPEPRLETHLSDGTPVVSEANILRHVQALEDIGYRVVGTEEAEAGELYVYDEIEALANQCALSDVLECKTWYQKGDGMHQFDIMDHAVLKSYRGIGNIILQVGGVNTTRTIEGIPINNAILLNAHIDSALPSPGAADDGIGVGVMLDCARVLIQRDQHIHGSAIFLFNGAEETLQDASHLYSMEHETKDIVKAVINLEAAGTTGAALLFQATSAEMIQAYAHATRPHGTVVAADVFSSGIILSDTDFVQFEKYLGISGLDLAIVGHSYYYHTQRDIVANIESGSSQHFAETTMAVLDHLLQAGSSLNTDTPWSPPNMVYYSFFDRIFIHYSMSTANLLCATIIMAYVALLSMFTSESERRVYRRALASSFANMLIGITGSVLVAVFLAYGLKKSHTWFTHEQLPLVIFGVPAVTSIFAFQYWLSRGQRVDQATQEHAAVFAVIGFDVIMMSLMQAFRIRSAYLFCNMAIVGLIPLTLNEVYNLVSKRNTMVHLGPLHWLWVAFSMPMIVEASTSFLDIFVPLTGRMGKEAPTEIIIAVISSVLSYVFLPPLVPLFYRFNRLGQRRILMASMFASCIIIAIFASPSWKSYDDEHPKRAGVQYMYNTTSGTHTLHIAQLDSGPGFPELVENIHAKYGMDTRMPVPSIPSDTNSDWDILYPISSFIEAEKFPIIGQALPLGEILPVIRVQLTEDVWDEALNTRNVTLKVNHEGLIYPVIAFSADVEEWSFQTAAPVGHTRHYVKAASSPGMEEFSFHMSLKRKNLGDKLNLHWVGIDTRQMFPATSEKYGKNLPTTDLFREMDAWLRAKYDDSMEVLMVGAVAGVVEL